MHIKNGHFSQTLLLFIQYIYKNSEHSINYQYISDFKECEKNNEASGINSVLYAWGAISVKS